MSTTKSNRKSKNIKPVIPKRNEIVSISLPPEERSIRDKLYDRIFESLSYHAVSFSGEHIYKVQWQYKAATEVYFLRYKDVHRMVDDILDEHPKIWSYRRALNALCESERTTSNWKCDPNRYWEIRERMLNLNDENTTSVFEDLRTLGPNPTQRLSADIPTSKKFATSLINKGWRTEKDLKSKSNALSIRSKIVTDIMEDPLRAMQVNEYVYSALKDYSWN